MTPALSLLASACAAGFALAHDPRTGWTMWLPSHPRARTRLGYDDARALLRLVEWMRRDGQAGAA